MAEKKQKAPFFQRLFGDDAPKTEESHVDAEKDRLEAFLAAVPGEYCGFAKDGSILYSQGFCDFLGLEHVKDISDIQNQLSPSDSAALDGVFERLQAEGKHFSLNVSDHTGKKTLKITGSRGKAPSGDAFIDTLWVEDVTEELKENRILQEERSMKTQEIERLQESLDSLPFPVWMRNHAQAITWVNVAYAKMLSSRPSEILSQQKEIVSTRKKKSGSKDVLLGPDLAEKSLSSGKRQKSEAHVVIGGNRVFVRVTETPVKGQDVTVGLLEDLSSQDELEFEIRNNQDANRGLLEKLRSAIAIYNAEQRLEFYNSAFSQLWDLEEGWLNTKPKLGEILEKLRETRRLPEQADFRKYKKSWLNMFTSLIGSHEDMLYLPNGNAVRMLVVPHTVGGLMMNFEDVTSRLELETSYNTLIAVQKETLDNLAEGVAVFGGDGRLKLWNPAFGRLWGLNPEELDGEPHITRIVERLKGHFSAEEWPETRDFLISLALERAMHEGRQRLKGETYFDYVTVPLPDGGVLLTYTDVTDTVRVETALRDKNAALEAAEKLKLDFLANVSYQLRTPLNAIMGFNDLLHHELFGPLNDKQKEYTRDIHESSERLLSLINDILDLSSFEAGYIELLIEEIKVKPMLSSVVGLVKDWARKEHVEVKLACASDVTVAQLDESRMKQAVLNILQNAISHSPEGGKIMIRASVLDDQLQIVVTDQGEGIPEEQKSRVLQPFERVEGGQQATRGVGLGLTLVQNIVDLHHGTFALENNKDGGTAAKILIPLKQPQQNASEEAAA